VRLSPKEALTAPSAITRTRVASSGAAWRPLTASCHSEIPETSPSTVPRGSEGASEPAEDILRPFAAAPGR